VSARLDEHDVVIPGVEHRLEYFEHIAAAVDNQDTLRGATARAPSLVRQRRARRDYLGLHRVLSPTCPPVIHVPCHEPDVSAGVQTAAGTIGITVFVSSGLLGVRLMHF
jgi:hypothetical protein